MRSPTCQPAGQRRVQKEGNDGNENVATQYKELLDYYNSHCKVDGSSGSSGHDERGSTATGTSSEEKEGERVGEALVNIEDKTVNGGDDVKGPNSARYEIASSSENGDRPRPILEDGLTAAGGADALPDYYEAVYRDHVYRDMPLLAITHPAGSFSQFVKYFDVDVFVLWKFSLLQKRILFFSRPPVGVICYRVYCACLLASHAIPYTFERKTNPLFYVNVADIHTLEGEGIYVACTTERVFEIRSTFMIYTLMARNCSHNHVLVR